MPTSTDTVGARMMIRAPVGAMTYRLAPDVHFALVDRRAVILDVAADRYRLLDGRLARVLVSLSQVATTEDEHALDALRRAHILIPGDGPIASPACPTIESSALEATPTIDCLRGVRRLSTTLIATVLRLRLLGLKSALDLARRKAIARTLVHDERKAIAMACSFAAFRPRIPIARICLRDSLTLFSLLVEAELDIQLVLGVRLDPFVAHSWVQTGSIVLSDDIEAVAEFTPILVL